MAQAGPSLHFNVDHKKLPPALRIAPVQAAGIEKAMADGVAIGPEWLMRTTWLERLTAGDHAFDPITEVCAKCYMTRAQWEDNRKPRCGGGTQQGLVRLFIDPYDEPGSKDE